MGSEETERGCFTSSDDRNQKSIISELGFLFQTAPSCSGFCTSSSSTADHQVAHYSDDVLSHVLSSFGSTSPITATQTALGVHYSEDTVLHGSEKGESSGKRSNFVVDSEETEQRESDVSVDL